MNNFLLKTRRYFYLTLLSFFLLPQTSFAVVDPMGSLQEAGSRSGLNTNLSATDIIARTINAILGLVGSVFVVLIIWSGFRWMTSAGNTDQIKKAKETMVSSVIGLAIIIASYVISYTILTVLVEGRLPGGGGGGKSDLDSLIESLRTEEEAITASYEARMLTVQTYTAAGSEQRAMLSAQVITATEKEMLKLSDMRAADFEGQMNAFTLIEDSLAESYQRRREIILENTQITEDQKLSLLTKAETAYTAQVRKLEASRNKVILDGTLQFFNDVASIGTAFGEKGFKIAKAAAIASATIAMWESATKAYNNGVAAGGSYYGVALGTVWAAGAVAAGTANIAKISATQYAGAYEHGGMIGAGQVGLVGEAGPELVTGPAMVRSARSTADMGAGRSEAAPVIVNVYNLPGQEVETRQTTGPNGEQQLDVIIKKVEQKFAGDAMNGGGSFVPAMAKAFHLSRA